MQRLINLRKRVKSLDQRIIGLIQKRLNLTREIGKEKKKLGMPLQDWNVEKSVIETAAKHAQKIGMDSNFVTALITRLIEQSRVQQERLHYSKYTGDREDILIIGGLGSMGRWFADFFQNQGHRVSIYDIKKSGIKEFAYYRNLARALANKTFVLIATPLGFVSEILNRICSLKFTGVVCDIGSVKSHLVSSIMTALRKNIKITSIHPMFGPSCATLTDKVICLCDCGCRQANDNVVKLFQDTAVKIITLPFDEHDRLISYILGLSHLINILFVRMLLASDYDFMDLKRVASTTFNSQLNTALNVIRENPELYYEIQSLNPYHRRMYKELERNLKMIIKTVENGDKRGFKKIFENGAKWSNEYEN